MSLKIENNQEIFWELIAFFLFSKGIEIYFKEKIGYTMIMFRIILLFLAGGFLTDWSESLCETFFA